MNAFEPPTTNQNPKLYESRLAVFKVRANFMAPYRKCKYIYMEPKILKSKKSFLNFLSSLVKNWPTGSYYLKLSTNQVFARFDVINGKVARFYEKSPITGKLYPIWEHWK
jgi:hypothetical protein